MARIVRPLHGRVQVEVPYRERGGNYTMLQEICGERTRPEWNPRRKCFEVARSHLGALLAQLPAELGIPVEVVLHGASQTTCVEACWRDASPETVWECVCSCAGKFHGTGVAPPKDLGGGLSVETEYTTESYTAWPNGAVTNRA